MKAKQVISMLALALMVSAQVAFFAPDADAQRNLRKTGRNRHRSGDVITEEREVRDFDEVTVKGLADVDISFGPEFKVIVTAHEDLIEDVRTDVRGDRLYVGLDTEENFFDWFDWGDDSDNELRISITMPELTYLNIKGIGEVDIDRFEGERLEVTLAGVGDLTIADFTGKRLYVDLTGVGSLDIRGEVDDLEVELSGVGDANLRNLEAKHVIAEVSGMGDLKVYASESIEAFSSGFGDIVYYGNPVKVRRRAKGFGDIYAGG